MVVSALYHELTKGWVIRKQKIPHPIPAQPIHVPQTIHTHITKPTLRRQNTPPHDTLLWNRCVGRAAHINFCFSPNRLWKILLGWEVGRPNEWGGKDCKGSRESLKKCEMCGKGMDKSEFTGGNTLLVAPCCWPDLSRWPCCLDLSPTSGRSSSACGFWSFWQKDVKWIVSHSLLGHWANLGPTLKWP